MSPTPRPIAIGLVGGIASGKSFVARELEKLGAAIIDADVIGHDVLRQPLVIRRVTQSFGVDVLDSTGKLDRPQLATQVFGDDPETIRRRRELEGIVHPIIHAEAVRALRTLRESPQPPMAVVIDAPLLVEANWAPMCDLILFVEASDKARLTRAQEDRGWTAEQFHRREASQLSLQEKRAVATHFVNGENEVTLREQLRGLWGKLDPA